jgi:hypothetical protein
MKFTASISSLLYFLNDTINIKVCFICNLLAYWLCHESECVLRKMMQVTSICLAQTEERFPGGSQTSPNNYLLMQDHEIQDRAHKDAARFAHSRFQCDLIFLPCMTKYDNAIEISEKCTFHFTLGNHLSQVGTQQNHVINCFVIKISVTLKI